MDRTVEMESEQNYPILTEIPTDILLKLNKTITLIDQLNLRKTSRALRNFIDSEPLFYRNIICEVSCCYVSIIFNSRNVIYSNIDIDIPYEGYDYDDLRHVKCEDYVNRATDDLCLALKNTKNHFNVLSLKARPELFSRKCDSKKKLENLKMIYTALNKSIKNLNHEISVNEFSMSADGQESVLDILPYLKNVTSIDISGLGPLGIFDKICDLDQWKNSKEVCILDPVSVPVHGLACLKKFDIQLFPVTTQILKNLKDALLTSTNFETGYLELPRNLKPSEIETVFESQVYERTRSGYKAKFPAPDSNKYLEIAIHFRFIWFSMCPNDLF